MKLYATVTSERATKGQGGQKYLNIVVKNEQEDTIMRIRIDRGEFQPTAEIIYYIKRFESPVIIISRDENGNDTKGEKQKGESYCHAQVGEQLCNNKVHKDDYCIKHYKMFNE